MAGQSFLSNGGLHAFFWRKGIMTDLGTLGGPDSFVNVANHTVSSTGIVLGYSETSISDPNQENFCNVNFTKNLVCLPFVWENGVMTSLPTLGGTNGQALGINDRGQIAGQAEGPNFDSCSPFALEVKAVIWREGQIQQVLAPFGGSAAVANAINDNGDAVGIAGCITGNLYAVLWHHGTPIDLGSLGGVASNVAFDINNRGQVIGQSDLPGDTVHHGFLWQNGVMADLDNLPGLPTSQADGINDQGQIVGFSQAANGDGSTAVAVLWQNGTITDLNTAIPADASLFLMEAVAINDGGQIAGWGRLSNGGIRPFLLTPCNQDDLSCEDSAASANAATSAIQRSPANNRAFSSQARNDRGEMFDINTLNNGEGRASLLVPCDENHPNAEGCDYSMVEDGAITSVTSKDSAHQDATSTRLSQEAMRRLMQSSVFHSAPWFRCPLPPPQN